jgi:hypothetical protein
MRTLLHSRSANNALGAPICREMGHGLLTTTIAHA